MEIYLVGGAVRDRLLGLDVHERDWVVVGARPELLEAKGYRRVGKDFPVFIHPETGDEYALARTERKTAPGYKGFAFNAEPDVTLEDDLKRRDLTINAIAETAAGELIDPWGGRADLEARVLRHVSPAFEEDPLRVLRVARFAARFSGLGFVIADETLELMQRMAGSGELEALVPERVWTETARALATDHPDVFFETLRSTGGLKVVFPELNRLFGVPQPEKWHPEIDTGVHVLLVLQQAAKLSDDTAVRFAALVHDLGKGTTPSEYWPSHRGHEQRGKQLVRELCERLRVPNEYRDLGIMVSEFHTHVHRALELKPGTLQEVLEKTDAFRRPERFEQFLVTCEADARGRTGLEERPYPQADYFRAVARAARAVTTDELDVGQLSGPEIGAQLKAARVEAIAKVKSGAA